MTDAVHFAFNGSPEVPREQHDGKVETITHVAEECAAVTVCPAE